VFHVDEESFMKIGAMVESFSKPIPEALAIAKSIGCEGVQMYVPGQWTAAEVAERRAMLDDSGLVCSGVCADFGGHGFMVADDNPARIERSKRAMDEALGLGTTVITTHIGVVPHDKDNPRYAVMADACGQLARHGHSLGATFAIETGPETGVMLRRFIDDVGEGVGLGVNFDPANLVMVCQDDVIEAVTALGPFIVHTHAKDGVNTDPTVNPEVTYGAIPTPEGVEQWGGFKEVPLGEGSVPWPEYLAALKAQNFDGYLCIERECGDDPTADIVTAVNFLKAQLAQ
jgi:L-ribulose-5-phosphate 3-epimerase